MTNKEYFFKKIDEEYQKYLNSLNIPSKEEWLKMEHKENPKEIKPKFKVGDHIMCITDQEEFVVDEIDMEIEAYTLHGNDADSDYYLLPIDEVDVDYFRIDRA